MARSSREVKCDGGEGLKTYDIINAGPNNRFMASGRIVSNSGRLVQFQNLPQNHLKDLKLARDLVKEGSFDDVELLFGNTPGTLSELIRTAFIPKEGHRFIVADFSAIEARVLSWIAGEKWRLEVFKSHGKIYEASASQMFHVPIEEITKGSPLRQKGKISELACIAEGELVLTDTGLVPIENITTHHRLWDGVDWVTHEGIIYKGMKEVIDYDGLRATKDHLVWAYGQSGPVQFGEVATSGAHLIQTGNGRNPIRMGENYQSRKEMEQATEPLLCTCAMCRLQTYSVDQFRESQNGKVEGMSTVLPAKASAKVVRQKTYTSKTKMSGPKSSSLPQVRCKRYNIQLSFDFGSRTLDTCQRRKCEKRTRNGSHKQQWPLRERQYSIYRKSGEPRQPIYNASKQMGIEVLALCKKCRVKETFSRYVQGLDYTRSPKSCKNEEKKLAVNRGKIRVYDIRNAGRYNRFTVSGKLVHNCGYGGGVGALKSMGALNQGVEEYELQGLIDNWRISNPRIVSFWWEVDRMGIKAVKERTRTRTHGIIFTYKSGMLFVTLPSGRNLVYVKPKLMLNKFGREGLTYEGIGVGKKWQRQDSYGPKIVENIIQGASRDLLAEAMLRLDKAGFSIVAHVHDEVVCEVPNGYSSVEEICKIMSENPKWSEGLPLGADGYECDFYMKD